MASRKRLLGRILWMMKYIKGGYRENRQEGRKGLPARKNNKQNPVKWENIRTPAKPRNIFCRILNHT